MATSGLQRPPDGDGSDEVGVDMGIVELDHGWDGKDFVCVSERSDSWLDLSDYEADVLSESEVLAEDDSEEFG